MLTRNLRRTQRTPLLILVYEDDFYGIWGINSMGLRRRGFALRAIGAAPQTPQRNFTWRRLRWQVQYRSDIFIPLYTIKVIFIYQKNDFPARVLAAGAAVGDFDLSQWVLSHFSGSWLLLWN